MIVILEGIARTGPDTARISAIKTLLIMESEVLDAGKFDALDSPQIDEVAQKRKTTRTKKPKTA